jgi:hypothetical protein
MVAVTVSPRSPGCRQGGPPGHWSGLAFVWANFRLCDAFLGPGAPQGKSLAQPGSLANSVALEPMALVLLAPFIGAISAAAAAAVCRRF